MYIMNLFVIIVLSNIVNEIQNKLYVIHILFSLGIQFIEISKIRNIEL